MGRGQPTVLHLCCAGGERALLKWHREEVGWRDWTPVSLAGTDTLEGLNLETRNFFLTVLGQA